MKDIYTVDYTAPDFVVRNIENSSFLHFIAETIFLGNCFKYESDFERRFLRDFSRKGECQITASARKRMNEIISFNREDS